MTDDQDVRTTEQEQRVVTDNNKVTQMIWLLLRLLQVMIALRIVFKLIPVNAANPFAMLLYDVTNFLVAPFASLTSNLVVGNMVFEISSLIAMIVYLLVAWAFARIVYVLFNRTHASMTVRQTIVSDHTPR